MWHPRPVSYQRPDIAAVGMGRSLAGGIQMRIVRPDAISVMRDGYYVLIESEDTIEITDAQWDELELQWRRHWPHHFNLTFSQYLRELISLTGEGK